MKLIIVPEPLRIAIEAAIDKVLDGRPCEPAERMEIYHVLLAHFDEHGTIPEFTLKDREASK